MKSKLFRVVSTAEQELIMKAKTEKVKSGKHWNPGDIKYVLNGKEIQPPAGKWPEIVVDVDYEAKEHQGSYADDDVEFSEGDDKCPHYDTEMQHTGDGCSCHIAPPCSYCVSGKPVCTVCGEEVSDAN